jgi:hypothetical protein
MTAYDATDWTEFFTASAGAAAALAGLVFVAGSINVERILQFKGLPERALATVLLLLCVVLVSLIGLIPGQGQRALAAELLGTGLLFGGLILWLTSPGKAEHERSKPGARREPLAPRRARDDPLRRGRGERVGRCGRRACTGSRPE